jgi:hypothetical protein
MNDAILAYLLQNYKLQTGEYIKKIADQKPEYCTVQSRYTKIVYLPLPKLLKFSTASEKIGF